GDTVHVILYADRSPVQIPEDLLLCLRDEPGAYEAFMQYSDGEKKAIVDWIGSATTDETRVSRIAGTLDKLSRLK
ncbi:MAG: YdeI/OmpD-associated family protein, partial [Bacteroidia bacterium]|nr:YdeI/OmpD-associated family protein [Bacteroidia bacterium]